LRVRPDPPAHESAQDSISTRHAVDYDESYYRSRQAWPDFRLEVDTLLRLANLTPESSILELGCGGGELLRRVEDRVRLGVGVDISHRGLGVARAAGLARLVVARVETLPFGDGVFDAVLAQHLVEHLAAPSRAMVEWRRVLRPGGRLLLVTPNAAYPDPGIFHDPTHLTLFTEETLRRALEQGGFRVVRLFTLFPYLGRSRILRAASIRLAPLISHVPGFSRGGRSLVAAAISP